VGGGRRAVTLPDGVRDRREQLLLSATSSRHGLALEPQVARTAMADLPGVWHVGVPRGGAEPWSSAAGGVGRDLASARLAAVGEALERYAAATCPLPVVSRSQLPAGDAVLPADAFSLLRADQVAAAGGAFDALYGDDADFTLAFSLHDNAPAWVPHELVALRGEGGLTTSSGLAAGTTSLRALLRAVQELVERDALMIAWLHGVPGRRVALPERLAGDVAALGGSVTCIDATPAYSPHPVALVAGSLPGRARPRFSLGAACRGTWEAAVEKAFLEWAQGVFFVGEYLAHHPRLRYEPAEVDTFDAHAVYYSTAPHEWDRIALLRGEPWPVPRFERPPTTAAGELQALVRRLRAAGVRLLYRDLTTVDLRQVGLHAVRALSPDLTPISCHEPLLGGRTADVLWRYPWAAGMPLCFPNPMPHPLG
jgi:ribosomal protein S12 methylthiotransferase accessory factor